VGVTHGREIHGQPKKLADPGWSSRRPIVGTLQRNGIDVVTGTMPYKQERADISDCPPSSLRHNITSRALDHIDGTPAIRQLTSRSLSDGEGPRMLARAPARSSFAPTPSPVHRLPVRGMG
jgi:acetoacetate decarboxylase